MTENDTSSVELSASKESNDTSLRREVPHKNGLMVQKLWAQTHLCCKNLRCNCYPV